MVQGGIAYALEQVAAALHGFVKLMRRLTHAAAKLRVGQLPVKLVELFPHRRIDRAPDTARVVARPRDARHDAGGIAQVEREPIAGYPLRSGRMIVGGDDRLL